MQLIRQSDLALNVPLPWPLFDEHGNLLLRKGYVLSIPRHIESLLARGAYAPFSEENEQNMVRVDTSHTLQISEPVFARVDAFAQNLKRLHAHVLAKSLQIPLQHLVHLLATEVINACTDDADALLAALHLNRQYPYLVIHQLLGAVLAEMIAREIGMPDDDRLCLVCAGLTRDISMLSMQAQLDQQTSELSPQETALIRIHPEHSLKMLKSFGVTDQLWLNLVSQHHERINGSGYPNGILGNEILKGSKILGITDSYAAMVIPRPNRQGKHPHDAMKDLYLKRNILYDNQLVQITIKTLTMYPPGTLVRLANGELAVVRNRQNNNESLDLWSIYDSRDMPIMRPERRDSNLAANEIVALLRVEECRSAELVLKRLWMTS